MEKMHKNLLDQTLTMERVSVSSLIRLLAAEEVTLINPKGTTKACVDIELLNDAQANYLKSPDRWKKKS
jgi:hypothetical protein